MEIQEIAAKIEATTTKIAQIEGAKQFLGVRRNRVIKDCEDLGVSPNIASVQLALDESTSKVRTLLDEADELLSSED